MEKIVRQIEVVRNLLSELPDFVKHKDNSFAEVNILSCIERLDGVISKLKKLIEVIEE